MQVGVKESEYELWLGREKGKGRGSWLASLKIWQAVGIKVYSTLVSHLANPWCCSICFANDNSMLLGHFNTLFQPPAPIVYILLTGPSHFSFASSTVITQSLYFLDCHKIIFIFICWQGFHIVLFSLALSLQFLNFKVRYEW